MVQFIINGISKIVIQRTKLFMSLFIISISYFSFPRMNTFFRHHYMLGLTKRNTWHLSTHLPALNYFPVDIGLIALPPKWRSSVLFNYQWNRSTQFHHYQTPTVFWKGHQMAWPYNNNTQHANVYVEKL